MAVLGEDKNHRMSVISEIGAAMWRLWPYVGFVGFVHRTHCLVGRLRVFVGRFVVEKGDLETTVLRRFLHETEIVIGERLAFPIPIHDETGNSHAAGLLDLPAEHVLVIAGVANVRVCAISEPWHVARDRVGASVRCLPFPAPGRLGPGRSTSGTPPETH